MSAADVVRLSSLPRSTVYRGLGRLAKMGFLYRDAPRRRYLLGPKILQLGMLARKYLAAEDVVGPLLLELQQQTGETVTLSILDGTTRLCAYVLEAQSELRQVAQAGARYPLHLGAAGKVILANMKEANATAILRNEKLSRTDLNRILKDLQDIHRAGYAVTSGERVPGASAVAAPVFVRDAIYGSLAVAGPRERMNEVLKRTVPMVVTAAQKVTRDLSTSVLTGLSGADTSRGGPRRRTGD